MSDYHVLQTNRKKDKATVAFHIPIASGINAAGVNYQTALTEFEPFGTTDSAVPNHDTNFASENTELVSGSMYERVETVEFDANANNAAKQAVIETRFTQLSGTVPGQLQDVLKFWGLNDDVP
jgi:hypothetical protein